MGKFSDTTNNK